MKIIWRDVFDTYKVIGKITNISDMLEFLKETGYEYFTWNGVVVKILDNYNNYEFLDVKVNDL